jgi:hypothetical protein
LAGRKPKWRYAELGDNRSIVLDVVGVLLGYENASLTERLKENRQRRRIGGRIACVGTNLPGRRSGIGLR